MGLRDELQSELAAAFDDDLVDAVNIFNGHYIIKGDDWDPVTETSTDTVIEYSGRGVLSRYSLNKIDNINILTGDLKLMALTSEVTEAPSVGHKITTKDLVSGSITSYSIISVGTDPTGATYSMQLRRA